MTVATSKKFNVFSKSAFVPAIIALFAIAFLTQVPHIYYLSDIMKLNQKDYVSLLIAYPIVATLVLSALSFLITEALLRKVRKDSERKLYRYVLRGATISTLIYFFCQFFLVFFLFQVIRPIHDGLPTNVIDNVTIKEIVGLALVLIIGFFINPPTEIMQKRK
ncbi:MAG: hypothetical protein ACTSYD_12860 [Candidatus Heimdallarchaeaceae archaeon]